MGLLSIPLVSVSSAVVVGDTASSNDPRRLAWGLIALMAGTAVGLLSIRLARASGVAIHILVSEVLDWSGGQVWTSNLVAIPIGSGPEPIPLVARDYVSIQRRGPPV